MNPSLVNYFVFIVAALILIWVVLEISRRLTLRKKIDAQTLGTWVTLDSTRNNAPEERLPAEDDEDDDSDRDDISDHSLHIRSQQNGHYSENKKPS